MKLVAATKNKGKLRELQALLADCGVEVISQYDICPDLDVEETGTTFAENAHLKAAAVYKATGLSSIADDSGLEVDFLNGAPGVYSARYAGEDATDDQRIEKLLSELGDTDQRSARFVSAISCILAPSGEEITAYGVCEGSIGFKKCGEGGFGYDPIFIVGDKSFAQMTDDEKNAISHRGRAMQEFSALFAQYRREK